MNIGPVSIRRETLANKDADDPFLRRPVDDVMTF